MKHRIPSVRKGGPARGPRPEGVALAWARDRDGRLTPVRALDEASRRARAPFTCPGCGDELVARLGAVRARHFAHRPGSRCPLTAPETALHFNAKARLLALCGEAFAGARRVSLQVRCPACRRLDARDLGALGDAAAAEGAVGPLRADVLVTRRGAPALALEVLVTHAVDAGKEAALQAAGVPAVEVDAREAWEREGAGPGPGRLPPVEVVVDRAFGFPPCAACRAEARAEADRALGGEAAQIAELESYRARGLLGPGLQVGLDDAPATDSRSLVARQAAAAGGSKRVKSMKSKGKSRPVPGTFTNVPGTGGDITAEERDALRARFRCPDCGGTSLLLGARLTRHPCPGQGERPVAWRGYDGALAVLGWWKR